MKNIFLTTGLILFCVALSAQIEGTSLPSLPSLTTAEMNGAINVNIGSSVFNTDDQRVYRYTTSGWVTTTDSQDLSIGTAGIANQSVEVAVSGGNNALVDIRDADSVIGNESVTGLAFDGTMLTLTQDGAGPETVDLSSVSADNIYTDDGTLNANRGVTQNNFDLNFDANTLVVSGDDNRVGVGTDNPTRKLDVNGIVGVFDGTRTTNAGMATEIDGGLINIGTNDGPSNRFGGTFNPTLQGGFIRVDSRNNQSLFQVKGRQAGATTEVLALMDVEADGALRLNQYGSGGFTGTATGYLGVDANGNVVETAAAGLTPDGDAWGVTGEDINSPINRLGDVAIGAAAPTAKLDVNGDVRIRNLNPGLPSDAVITKNATGVLRQRTAAEIVAAGGGLDNTDNQAITTFALNPTTNILTLTLEDGGTETVNLNALADADGDAWGVTGEDTASAISRTGDVTLTNTSKTALTLQTADNALTNGLAFQNSGGNYTWNIFREPNATDDADGELVFAGGANSTSIDGLEERMRLDSNGNLGIGTANPTQKLTVNTSALNQINIGQGSTGPRIAFSEDDGASSEGFIQYRNSSAPAANYPNSLTMFTGGTNDLWFNANPGSPDLWIEGDNGNVGIGTDTPDTRLDVENGTVRFSDYGGGAITGTATNLLGVDVDGDVIEVDATTFNDNPFNDKADDTVAENGDTSIYLPGSRLQVGTDGSAAVAVTLNDGGGNANLTFNHAGQIPDSNGSSARIRTDVDGTTAGMGFQLADNVTAGAAPTMTTVINLRTDNIDLNQDTDITGNLDVNGNARVRTLPAGAAADGIVTTDANGNLRQRTAAQIVAAGGGVTTDGQLGTDNQTLTANRTVTQANFDLNFDANTLVVSGDNDRIGVGTANPNEKFHLRSGNLYINDEGTGLIVDALTNKRIGFMKYSGREAGIWRTATQDFEIGRIVSGDGSTDVSGTAGNTYEVDIAVSGTGNVGIGVAPSAKLDVNGNARVRTIPASADTDQLVTADANGNLRQVNSLKASKVFYPPSIAIDASSPDPATNRTIDLHAQYIAQFGSPVVSSAGTIPIYAANELDYHVTFADPSVFGNGTTVQNMSVDANGILTYRIFDTPADYNSLINVVFVVR